MGLKKDIQISTGEICSYHAVYQFTFDASGRCLADIGAYADAHSALIKRKPGEVYSVRCDGVTPTEDVIQQIYCIVAHDPRYEGAEAFSEEAAFGLANPRIPLPEKPPAPTAYHYWNSESEQWELDSTGFAVLQDQARQRINTSRNKAERAGFEAYGKLFDSDDKAVQRISVAAQAAMLAKASGITFSKEWTVADNTTVLLDADQIMQLPIIMASAGNALHIKARGLKALINQATTEDELNSIQW